MRVSLISEQAEPALLKRLQTLGHRVQRASPERIESLSAQSADLVYLVPMAQCKRENWAEVRVRLARASRYYVVCGRNLSTGEIMEAARDGAHDVVDASDDDERWQAAMEHASSSQSLWWQLYGAADPVDSRSLVGRSGAMQTLRESVQRIGPTDATVLVLGESGTGKERVSEAIHKSSGREQFVTVNCAAIPSELMEAELFGVEKGAYTGANRSRPGLVEEAANGTLFLDEIGEMDIILQPKLLRFLETRRARRVGSTKEYACQVRVISATNRDLQAESESGNFRLDLYYRLSEVMLSMPPLRHRATDIPDLAKVFLEGAAVRLGKNFETIEPELIYKFQLYSWPGNVRELKQVIERLAIYYNGPVMRAAWWDQPVVNPQPKTQAPFSEMATAPAQMVAPMPMLPPGYAAPGGPSMPYPYPNPAGPGAGPAFGAMPSKREKLALARRLIADNGDDLAWVAAQVGVHPTTLYRWRKSGKV